MIDRREFFGVAPGMKSPTGDKLETIMHNEPIDFVGFDYSVGDRRAEQTLLPLAKTWAQFFLKYVSQPPGRHRSPYGDEQREAHAREHRRRHRAFAE